MNYLPGFLFKKRNLPRGGEADGLRGILAKAFPFDKMGGGMLDSEMIEDTAKIVDEAIKDKVQVNLIINNRAGGNAPLIAEKVADRLHSEMQQDYSDSFSRLSIPFLEPAQDIGKHFFMFQDNGEEDCLQRPGMRHVNRGSRMEFGPVEESVKGFLVFFAQTFAKPLPPPMLLFQDITERHHCPAHRFLPTNYGTHFFAPLSNRGRN